MAIDRSQALKKKNIDLFKCQDETVLRKRWVEAGLNMDHGVLRLDGF